MRNQTLTDYEQNSHILCNSFYCIVVLLDFISSCMRHTCGCQCLAAVKKIKSPFLSKLCPFQWSFFKKLNKNVGITSGESDSLTVMEGVTLIMITPYPSTE